MDSTIIIKNVENFHSNQNDSKLVCELEIDRNEKKIIITSLTNKCIDLENALIKKIEEVEQWKLKYECLIKEKEN